MGKVKFNEDLETAVHELGGDDEDLKLVMDADFSGSDFEDTGAADGDLNDEVSKMWEQLSGNKAEPKTSKDFAKKESQEKINEKKKEPKKEPKQDKVELKNSKKAAKEPKELKETKPVKTESTKKDFTKESKEPKKEPKKDTKKEVKPPPKPQPIVLSKKAKIEWEKYLNTLNHPNNTLLIDEQKWEATAPEAPKLPIDIVNSLKEKANQLLTTENQLYFSQRSADREFSSSLEFLKSGTFYDQLGTLSILSTESPLHSVRFLENLIDKCEIKHRESACKALEVTKDLLVSHVLPDRRLKWFADQPLQLNLPMTTLMSFAFEDYLKKFFFKLLQAMERLLNDTVENIRLRSLHCVFDFFRQKPEQEANLLRLGLNKLGDPAGKVASRVKRLVMDSLQMHPAMKPIIATAVAEVLGRATDYRTRYYSVDLLSEFILSNRDPGLANQLIYIYLDLFERLLAETSNNDDSREEKAPSKANAKKSGKRFRPKRGKKGGIKQAKLNENEVEQQQHARLVSKIFTGLNRAFPFSKLDPVVFKKYIDTLYYMSHSPNVGTFIEALCFIYQLSNAGAKTDGNNRYQRALYESLLDNRLQASSKLAKYIHLLLKSMASLKKDNEEAQMAAFIKRILQIACNWSEVGAIASLVHTAHLASNGDKLINSKYSEAEDKKEYDYKQRDPRYANAENSKAWELVLLQKHYHPTVVHYANNFLAPESEKIHLDMPDIEQYTVNSFLSKWSYKNPKTKEVTRGGSIFQPLSGYTDLTLGIRQEKKTDNTPASMQNWKIKNKSQVAPDEQFLYEYFSHRPDRAPKKSKETENDASDASDAESIDDDEVNEAMAQSGPGDLGGIDLTNADFSEDDDDDGDLEADLEAAFKSDDDDDDIDDDDDLDDADEGADVFEDAETGAEPEDDDFADFDGEMSVQKETSSKKRKRWSNYPTFMDADQLEEMLELPAKKR